MSEESVLEAIETARKKAIDAINELGNDRARLIVVLTKIMNVVDRVNPAGRTCSINDMTNALLEIREAAFQAVAVPVDHESRQPTEPRLSAFDCAACGKPGTEHCDIHLIPCCPGKCMGPVKRVLIEIVEAPGDMCGGTKLVDTYSLTDGKKYLGQKPCPGCRACS